MSQTLDLVVPAAAAAFAVAFAVALAIVISGWRWAMDHPNERSLHVRPTPRTGGLAIMAGIAAGMLLLHARGLAIPLTALALALALAGLSLADDRGGLPISARLLAHLIAAALFASWLTDGAAPWWWMLVAMLAIATFSNFFNFMDGANGLAGGMASIGFGSYGLAALAEAPGFAGASFAAAAAAAAFLSFNLRGRIFMGDSGSVPLGYLASAFGLEGWVRGYWPAWFPLAVFAPFVVDAGLTLTKRILRGERFWEAHRDHYYQRLVRSGLTHSRLALLEYIAMTICAAAGLAARAADGGVRYAFLATIAVFLAGAAILVDLRWRAHEKRFGSSP